MTETHPVRITRRVQTKPYSFSGTKGKFLRLREGLLPEVKVVLHDDRAFADGHVRLQLGPLLGHRADLGDPRLAQLRLEQVALLDFGLPVALSESPL